MILIEKYTKLKDGNYKLKLNNNQELKLHEDLILKYNLLLTKKLDDNLINILYEEQKVYDIYNIALKYIKIRIRSVKEIENYLLKKQYDTKLITEAIEILKRQGYLNNENYAKAYIHDKIYLSNSGPIKIMEELRKNGIDEQIINKCIEEFNTELEKERITKLISKQVKNNHNKSSMMLKRKIESNLISLGYHKSLITEVLSKTATDDNEIYKKEYDKIYKKLSKKYSGRELEYKINQKLYQKGFKKQDDFYY